MTALETRSASMKIAAVVLAGGRSRRFGRDKAREPFGDKPLLHWSLEAMRPCADLLAINGPGPLAQAFNLPAIFDFPGSAPGPLAGLLGAMDWAATNGCSHLLTTPCDTPFLPSDMAGRLIAGIGEGPVVAARAARVHALCALWRVDIADDLEPIARKPEQPSLQRIIDQVGGGYIDFPDEAAFANLNSEAELIAAQGRWNDTKLRKD